MPEAILTVNGKRYGGWKSVEISLSMESIANSFTFTASEKFPGQPEAWELLPGDACTVSIGKEVVITGYIDDVDPVMTSEEHTITVSGRDKTGDLVDCSAVHKSGEWHGFNALRIAEEICLPFGINVIAMVDVGKKLKKFSIWQGESAFEFLERLARMRGLLLVSDGLGNLVITRAGSEKLTTPLILGQNIEGSSGRSTWRDRYSHYIIKGQDSGGGHGYQKQKLQAKGSVEDEAITRYRPLLIIAEPGDGVTYNDRAIWERNIRTARCQAVTYSVTGWQHSTGIWRPNSIVPVQDPSQKINGFRIINRAVLRLDEQATRAELTVTDPAAYELINLSGRIGWN